MMKRTKLTKQVTVFLILAALATAVGSSTRAASDSNNAALDPLPRDLEVKLALSALPPHLRADATVYILDPKKGYILERQGTNGFSCFVERTDYTRAQARFRVHRCGTQEAAARADHSMIVMISVRWRR